MTDVRPVVEELPEAPDPPRALARLRSLPFPVLLESADRRAGTSVHDEAPPHETSPSPGVSSRYSFLAADPFLLLYGRDGEVEARWLPPAMGGGPFGRRRPPANGRSGPGPGRAGPRAGPAPLHAVADLLRRWRIAPIPGLPPFQGGLAGFLGYELAHSLHTLPPPLPRELDLPELHLGAYDWVLAWDHRTGGAWLVSTGRPLEGDEGRRRARDRAREVRRLLGSGEPAKGRARGEAADPPAGTAAPAPDPPSAGSPAAGSATAAAPAPGVPGPGSRGRLRLAALHEVEGLPGVRSPFTREGYMAAVERIRRYIRAGDVFQVNLTQRLEAPLGGTGPLDLYRRLCRRNPAPFAAYLETERAAVVSASPERFLRVDGERVETRPIKGTAPRGTTPEEDRQRLRELLASEKDRAENVMIVDLLRNDLSRVCRDGTVEAPAVCAPESHPTVHHLVSTVRGRLRAGVGPADVLAASFPGGSITGAPKLRAMEIIRELEPTRREVYTGSIGYVGFDGSMDVSIAIRTFLVQDGVAWFPAGGGVVVDSDPESEYRESLDKARGLAAALGPEGHGDGAPAAGGGDRP